MKYSRHGPGLDLTKGGLILNGVYFWGKPTVGVSIATWVKLSTVDGSHVIFRSTSKKNFLSKTAYFLEINDGRIHWSHHNDIGGMVFMVISPQVVEANSWNHAVVTYDSISQKAKVMLNGKVKAVGRGHGILSDQWGDTFFGSISEKKQFNGFLDEVYMFKRPLENAEVKRYLENMDTRNLLLNKVSENGLSYNNTDFPSLSATVSSKVLHSMRNKHRVTLKSLKVVKNKASAKNRHTHISHLEKNIAHSMDEDVKGLFSELSRAAVTSDQDHSTCTLNGSIYHKWTFLGGLEAGKFARIADDTDMENCISKCCDLKLCDAAIMNGKTCFSLLCKDRKLCELRPAQLDTFDLVIAFVKRTNRTEISSRSKKVTAAHRGRECAAGIRVVNVTINAGLGAGEVIQYRNISTIDDCVAQCCDVPKCNTAFLVQGTCYAIFCVLRGFCKVRPPPSANFLSEVVYVNKSGVLLFSNPQDALMVSSKPPVENKENKTVVMQPQSSKNRKNSSTSFKERTKQGQGKMPKMSKGFNQQSECRIEKVASNVRLAGDLNAGIFIDHGLVTGIKACIMKCCSDTLCNVTYLIDRKCFSVRCHSEDLCKTIPALSMALSPTIAHVRQHGAKGECLH